MSSKSDSSSMQRVALDGAAVLLLLFLTAFFFWRLWASNPDDRVRFPSGDFTEQYYPLRYFVAASYADGQLPFWNPYIFGGQPGLADPQAAALYPPFVLNALYWGRDFSIEALQFEAVAHIGWALVGTYFFVSLALRLGRVPALVGAIIFGFGGYLTGFALEQLTILETLAWLPWLLLALHYAAYQRQQADSLDYRRWAHFSLPHRQISSGLAALVFGCAALAGHPQSALYLAYVGGAYGLFLLAQGWRDIEWRERLLSGAFLFMPFVLGVGLAAAQLLPTIRFIEESSRESLSYAFVEGGLSWFELMEMFLPKVAASTPLYVGTVTLLLAPLGLLSNAQRGQKRFWGLIGLICLLIALGGNAAFFDFLYLGVPGWDSVRNQARILILWNWSMALLAAWGMAFLLTLTSSEKKRAMLRFYVRRVGAFLPIFFLPLLVFWWLRALEIAQWSVNGEIFQAFFEHYSFSFVLFLLAWGLLAWGSITRMVQRTLLFGGLALLLLIFDLFSITRLPHMGPKFDTEVVRHTEIVDALKTWRHETPSRIGIVGAPRPRENDGMYWGFPLLSGNTPMRIENISKLFEKVPGWRQFQLLGAQYVVSESNLSAEDPASFEWLAESDSQPKSYLLRHRAPRPYAWLVGQYEQIDGENATFRRLAEPDFDPYQRVLIRSERSLSAEGAANGTLTIERRDMASATVRVVNPGSEQVILIFAEPSIRGWQILLDGEPGELLRVNGINLATFVPPGEHQITLSYALNGWREGIRISAICLLIVALMLEVGVWERWVGEGV